MSLLNLKRKSPSSNKTDALSHEGREARLEAFINGAVAYSAGQSRVVPLHPVRGCENCRCKKANFSLNDQTIERLNLLSQHTGIPKSRLIRIWLDQLDWNRDLDQYLRSTTP